MKRLLVPIFFILFPVWVWAATTLGTGGGSATSGAGGSPVILGALPLSFPINGTPLDDFNRGTGIGANWAESFTDANYTPFTIVSDTVAMGQGEGDPSWSHWAAATFGPDAEVYVTLANVGNDENGNVAYVALWNTTVNGATDYAHVNTDGYVLEVWNISGGNDYFYLAKIVDGVPTDIPVAVTVIAQQTISNGDSIGLSMTGSNLRAWYKAVAGSWVQLGVTVTDVLYGGVGPYTDTKKLGLGTYGFEMRFDNFGGGTR